MSFFGALTVQGSRGRWSIGLKSVALNNRGVGLRDSKVWNYALLGKQLWDISNKKDSLWIKWVAEEYLHGASIWECTPPSTASWHWQRLLKVRDSLLALVQNGELDMNPVDNFPVQKVYLLLHEGDCSFPLHRMIWNHLSVPKHAFITSVTLHKRLLTKDRVVRWLPNVDLTCTLCGDMVENMEHLFFHCLYSQRLL